MTGPIVDVKEIEMDIHTEMVTCVSLSRDGHIGISGGLDKFACLWNAKHKQVLQNI